MRYRVIAVPASYVAYESFVVEDQDGRLFLFEQGRLSSLAPEEMALALTVFELSQSFDWHGEDDLPRLLSTLRDAHRYHFSAPSRSRSATSAAA